MRRRCEDLNDRGQGRAFDSARNRFIFADSWLPQEEAELEVLEEKSNCQVARVKKLYSSHPGRTTPPCTIFSSCGGCSLQHLSYLEQLNIKKGQLKSLLKSYDIKIPSVELDGSDPFEYRHKLLLRVKKIDTGFEIGFFKRKSQQIVTLENSGCRVQSISLQKLIEIIPDVLESRLISSDALRFIFARSSYHTGNLHLSLGVSNFQEKKLWKGVTEALAESFQKVRGGACTIEGASLIEYEGKNNRLFAGKRELLWGLPFLKERLLSMDFNLDPHTFFQVNPKVAATIWQQIEKWCQIYEIDFFFELYCGMGLLSNYLALQGLRCVGLERDALAVERANELAKEHNVEEYAKFFAVDLEDFQTLEDYCVAHIQKKVFMLNPPRKGLSVPLKRFIAKTNPPYLFYMACGMESFCQDALDLKTIGYEMKTLRAYDLFPQTMHFELLAIFKHEI